VQETTRGGEYNPFIVILKQLTARGAQSGLTDACLKSPHAHDFVKQEVLNYIKDRIPQQRTGFLAGNSVYADRGFLVKEMPEVVDWLHYRWVPYNPSICRWPTRGVSPLQDRG
jgi:oligoribonuclease (3'-5' exoribonuclease)